MASQEMKWKRLEQELNEQIYSYERERKMLFKRLGLTNDFGDSESEDEDEPSDEDQENRVPSA